MRCGKGVDDDTEDDGSGDDDGDDDGNQPRHLDSCKNVGLMRSSASFFCFTVVHVEWKEWALIG